MSEWKMVKLGDVLTLQRGFDITKANQRPGTVPVVSSGGIGSHHDTAMVEGPGVVIGRKGTLGKVFYLPHAFWPHDTTLWVKDFKGNQPRFVYYYLQTIDFLSMNVGSSNPTLNRNHVHPIEVLWPDLPTQRATSSLLGALDDKIAVNDRTITTCIEMASSLLQWEETTAETTNISLREAASWLSGGTPKTSEPTYWSGELPWISAASLKSFLIGDSERKLTAIGASSGTKVVPPGTTICVVRGMSLKTEFRMGISMRELAFGQDCKAFIPRGNVTPHVLAYSLWNNRTNVLKLVDEAGHGTGRLDSKLLGTIQLAIPSNERIGPLEERLAHLTHLGDMRRQESGRLCRLRDALLPKLMSGQVRIKDAEKVVEDAV